VGAEGDGAGVEIRVFDGVDSEVDRSEAAHAASVRPCASADSAKTVRIEARASAGHMDAVLGQRLTGK
jgi:hypothetical protein